MGYDHLFPSLDDISEEEFTLEQELDAQSEEKEIPEEDPRDLFASSLPSDSKNSDEEISESDDGEIETQSHPASFDIPIEIDDQAPFLTSDTPPPPPGLAATLAFGFAAALAGALAAGFAVAFTAGLAGGLAVAFAAGLAFAFAAGLAAALAVALAFAILYSHLHSTLARRRYTIHAR